MSPILETFKSNPKLTAFRFKVDSADIEIGTSIKNVHFTFVNFYVKVLFRLEKEKTESKVHKVKLEFEDLKLNMWFAGVFSKLISKDYLREQLGYASNMLQNALN